jgi:hypothetical protein
MQSDFVRQYQKAWEVKQAKYQIINKDCHQLNRRKNDIKQLLDHRNDNVVVKMAPRIESISKTVFFFSCNFF